MFDLVALNMLKHIFKEFNRVLKPGGRMVLVNMSKNTPRKTLYEIVYELVRLFPCRPVLMEMAVREAGFMDVQRLYRSSHSGLFRLPFGTEIVTAYKSGRN